jgi:hypothetical protein
VFTSSKECRSGGVFTGPIRKRNLGLLQLASFPPQDHAAAMQHTVDEVAVGGKARVIPVVDVGATNLVAPPIGALSAAAGHRLPAVSSHRNLIASVPRSMDTALGFGQWLDLCTPDLFEVELDAGRPVRFVRLDALRRFAGQ